MLTLLLLMFMLPMASHLYQELFLVSAFWHPVVAGAPYVLNIPSDTRLHRF
jgi:hypothetical protein